MKIEMLSIIIIGILLLIAHIKLINMERKLNNYKIIWEKIRKRVDLTLEGEKT